MRDVRELLAILTAHGIDPLKVPGGKPLVTQMDVAGMMARCAPCESALLRAKYCGEPAHEAWAYWFTHLMRKRWAAKVGRVSTLSRVTLTEHLSSNRCPACMGTQGRMIANKYEPCPKCDGSGVRYLTNRKIAEVLGFDQGLKSPWTERLEWCRGELTRWEQAAISRLR